QWGVADDSSYLFNMPVPNRNDWPYLFDADHQPKLAYEMVMDF
ncbi:MAG TPA: endo-1,4-beta-xylanase, partial [Firmicutes bacterium]|nr:endo-1,4-beta-xylanase [Bacillota bacterium]